MAHSKKQDIIIGNGSTGTPILDQEKDPTAAVSILSPQPTSIESGSTKPRSLAEALSLLQTNCFDLRGFKCEVSILARGKRLYIIATLPPDTGLLDIEHGHITIAGKPVILG